MRKTALTILNEIKKYAIQNGGICLSTEYINSRTSLHFQCKEGHEWHAAYGSMKFQNSWCLLCASRTRGEKTREASKIKLLTLLESKGGRLLSDFSHTHAKHTFMCAIGHQWMATPHTLMLSKNPSWCPYCSGTGLRDKDYLLAEIKRVAQERGGQCLSNTYTHNQRKHHFRCIDGHEWDATPNDIKNGYWCPSCVNKTEALVRQFFESIFEQPFPNIAPSELQPPKGQPRVILDGYNAKLRLAFEYHGIQHQRHVKHFHERGGKTLIMQKARDQYVRQACSEHGITLIEIEALPNNYSLNLFTQHLLYHYKKSIVDTIAPEKIERFLNLPMGISKLNVIRSLAQSKGGRCLEEKYISSISKMRFQCINGHIFEAIPKTIKKGHWCPICAGCSIENPLNFVTSYASERNGKCLSINYVNSKSKLTFECVQGHIFESTMNAIRHQKQWCPYCSKNRIISPLQDLQEKAATFEGECVSTEYVRSDYKLLFRCKNGHEFMARPSSVKRGHWCPKCSASNRIKIDLK